MTFKVVSEFAVGQRPDLHDFVPASRDDDRRSNRGRESHARDPLGVSLLRDGVFAFSKSVPDFHGAITTARNDLSVVGGEGY